ncbi:putative transcriptional regulator with metal-binding domain (Helix-turn-helix protein, CopG family); putative transcriptional repressor of nickel transport, nickel-responsive (nikR) [Bradyrhizobium sp. ORS 278]|uniref:nickel-responsive transcriptional regulator NikR n=1 Tax=Bradyrhizobium sp. (strain ORS 278) TaxID=114615 RepID=UPI0001507F9A|nr:nickel-responsive transcriptional regulator NikR [Bradyrhizobium sp. ORS 278]CAL79345.1 putative transcriptional regulator with metal-binding domain (Helix-turn-helix protein, CopG family); putative transcriptional repressor of nickel transport, nickel-responsive (nikR) [Bradyrhizobium sp. ORS 278]
MQRLTITIDDDLLAEVDAFMARRGYDNRSEAFRDLLRSGLESAEISGTDSRHCIATLSYVYDHAARELPKRLTQEAHDHSGLAQATLHVHIDQESCLEVTVLKGERREVKAFADHVIAERGVRHGHVALMPIDAAHDHGHAHSHSHSHSSSHSHSHSHTTKSGKK